MPDPPAELPTAQSALDRHHELATAPRDFAVTKVIEAFNRFAASAKAAKKPLAITIRLSARFIGPRLVLENVLVFFSGFVAKAVIKRYRVFHSKSLI